MSIAVTEDHRALAQTVADFLAKHQARASARGLLESDEEQLPGFWAELAGLGMLGMHLPEELGGAGFTLSEVLVVAEQLGRAVAPGPFVPTVITSALIAAAAPEDLRQRLLPGLADGSLIGAAALGGDVAQAEGTASGDAGVVISGALADILLVPSGDDVLVIEKALGGVAAEVPTNLDPSRRAAKVRLEAARATALPGARGLLTDIARTVFAAEAAGIAAEVTDQASAYAKTRVQFGRPIATFQAVKHHCANMLVAAELATAAAWDAGRAGVAGGDQLSYTAAIAATRPLAALVSVTLGGAIGGLILASQLGAASPQTATGLELSVVTAVILAVEGANVKPVAALGGAFVPKEGVYVAMFLMLAGISLVGYVINGLWIVPKQLRFQSVRLEDLVAAEDSLEAGIPIVPGDHHGLTEDFGLGTLGPGIAGQRGRQFLEIHKPERQSKVYRIDELGQVAERRRVFVVDVQNNDVGELMPFENALQNARHRRRFAATRRSDHHEMLA